MTRLNSAFKTEQEEKMAAGDLDGLAEMNSRVIWFNEAINFKTASSFFFFLNKKVGVIQPFSADWSDF